MNYQTGPVVAVVTGGAGGMGLETARIMGAEHAIVIADLSQERLDVATAQLAEAGVDARGVVTDITDRSSVDRLFTAAGELGRVRAVVHTAGVSPQMGDAALIARVNAVGTVHVTQAFLEIAQEGDALVNVASVSGHIGPSFAQPVRTFKLALTDVAGFQRKIERSARLMPKKALRPGIAYSTSKAFVIWYSAKMAAAFGAKGARVLSVSPGSFDTAMGRLEVKSGSDKLLDYAALKRFGRPAEIGEVLAFAASDRPGYLTGVDILVDGGTKAGLDLKGVVKMARGS